jgi:excinuclease ABC subunit A
MDKPEADRIEGITPAIAIQQKAVTKNPRSTVATVTEIYDFLRVLYARIGIVHCQKCDESIERDTIDSMIETLYTQPPETKVWISFSWSREAGLEQLRKDGFARLILNKTILDRIETNEKGWQIP